MKKNLHRQAQQIINHAFWKFKNKCPRAGRGDLLALRKRFKTEFERVAPIFDESILKATIIRARYTFWVTLVVSVLLVGLLGAFTGGTILPFVSPFIMALASWLVTCATIPVMYNGRIKGSMNSIGKAWVAEQDIKNSGQAEPRQNIATQLRWSIIPSSSSLNITQKEMQKVPSRDKEEENLPSSSFSPS